MLAPSGLTNILENYAQVVEEKDPRTGKKKRRQVWPRYHQLRLVRQALADVCAHGAGKRYLIQHSAGSGKSNSIAWLSHQLIGLKRDDIAPKVAADAASQNAKANTPHTARLAHDQALGKAAQGSMKDFTQFYKQFVENESFRRFVGDMVYALTSQG